MESSLWLEIKRHPQAMAISIVLHVLMVVVLVLNLSHSEKPSLPMRAKVKTVQAVVVDAAVVDSELNKLKKAEQRQQQKEQQHKQQLKKEMEQAREQRRKEEKRLAELKRQQQQNEKDARARQAKLEAERKQKQQELTELKQQQQDLEHKRQAEQQRLAAIEARRKAEEDAARKKKEAEQAEVRRKAEEADLIQRMEEEEAREMENNTRLQTLRSQYAQMIEQQVARNWLPPANMTKGWFCEVMVMQNRLGDITQVQMLKCSGSDAFKSTVERAVRKASPLPSPPSPDVFDQKLQFTFRPEI